MVGYVKILDACVSIMQMIIFIAFLFLVIQISLSPMSLDLFNYVEETYAQHSE